MTARGFAHGVDKRPPGSRAEHEDLTAFGAIHESLAGITVDHQAAAAQDLPDRRSLRHRPPNRLKTVRVKTGGFPRLYGRRWYGGRTFMVERRRKG